MADLHRTTLKEAAWGGAAVSLVMMATALTVGLTNGSAAQDGDLLEGMIPVAEALFSTAMIASSTTLALMLTMLGITADQPVRSGFYGQIRQAATLTVAIFAIATVALIFLAIPFHEADWSGTFHSVLYYGISGVGAAIGGGLVAVMITMHGAVRNLIGFVDDEEEDEISMDD